MSSGGWCSAGHGAARYANRPLILFGEDDDDIPSTISQPSLVLRMPDLLQLGPGHTVCELGAGSGWNAALMAHLVGPTGHVYSLEMIPEVAEAAGAPYDRAIFTAGWRNRMARHATGVDEALGTTSSRLLLDTPAGGRMGHRPARRCDDPFGRGAGLQGGRRGGLPYGQRPTASQRGAHDRPSSLDLGRPPRATSREHRPGDRRRRRPCRVSDVLHRRPERGAASSP
jgi:hypothetical protein